MRLLASFNFRVLFISLCFLILLLTLLLFLRTLVDLALILIIAEVLKAGSPSGFFAGRYMRYKVGAERIIPH